MQTIERFKATKRISGAVSYNGMIFLSGQTADDRVDDVRIQTDQILTKIERLLAEAGSS